MEMRSKGSKRRSMWAEKAGIANYSLTHDLKKKSSYNSIIVVLLYLISHSLTQLCISVHIVGGKYAKPFQQIHLKCLRRFHDTSFKVNNSCVCNLLQLIQNKQWSVSRKAAAITSDNEIKTHDFLSTKKLWIYLSVSWKPTWTTVVKSSTDFLPFLTFIIDIALNKVILCMFCNPVYTTHSEFQYPVWRSWSDLEHLRCHCWKH